MKTTRGILLEITLLGLFLCVALVGAASYLNHALTQENRLTARRLERAFTPLIAKAHHQKDDLALQDVISALAQAPGVSFAAVIDPDDKIVAHSRLAQIGKSFRGARGEGPTMSYLLKDGALTWGTLVFSLSTRSTDALCATGVSAMMLFSGLLLGGCALRLQRNAVALNTLRSELTDTLALLDESQAATNDVRRRMEAAEDVARASLSAALNRLNGGALLLDARQRVLMVNHSALSALEVTEETLGAGVSWQDVPMLQDHGAALEQSLNAPGRLVLLEPGAQETAGALLTEVHDGVQLTWFTPRPVLRVSR